MSVILKKCKWTKLENFTEKCRGKIEKFGRSNEKIRCQNWKILMQKRCGELGKFGKSKKKRLQNWNQKIFMEKRGGKI